MTSDTHVKPPVWFWVVSALALIWNLMGVIQFIMSTMSTHAELLEAYGEKQANMMKSQPAWYPVIFAMAVFGGALGCLGLLLRKKWALWLLVISLVGVIIQNIYFAMSGVFEYVHGGQWVMVLMIPIIAVLLVLLARKGITQGWLK